MTHKLYNHNFMIKSKHHWFPRDNSAIWGRTRHDNCKNWFWPWHIDFDQFWPSKHGFDLKMIVLANLERNLNFWFGNLFFFNSFYLKNQFLGLENKYYFFFRSQYKKWFTTTIINNNIIQLFEWPQLTCNFNTTFTASTIPQTLYHHSVIVITIIIPSLQHIIFLLYL